MSKGIVNRLFGTLSLICFAIFKGYAQDIEVSSGRIMFYNVENLFDIYDDPLTDDDDFLPDGLMRWNFTRYDKKIDALYKTIIAAGEWTPPAVVALCEIENRKVIEDLLYKTNLLKYDYRIIHQESPDERGIDVAMIYRRDLVKLIFSRYFIPYGSDEIEFTSRSILYAKCLINKDTIHFFANHWPSRRGGVLAGEHDRKRVAELLKEKVDSIALKNMSGAKIIIMGDFNCTPEDPVINNITSGYKSGISLVNISERLSLEGSGTYRYAGTWEMIDQIIVSGRLLTSKTGISADHTGFSIFKPDFLLRNDTSYPGLSPFSTYRGYRYQGGFSDHLPVYIDLTFN